MQQIVSAKVKTARLKGLEESVEMWFIITQTENVTEASIFMPSAQQDT